MAENVVRIRIEDPGQRTVAGPGASPFPGLPQVSRQGQQPVTAKDLTQPVVPKPAGNSTQPPVVQSMPMPATAATNATPKNTPTVSYQDVTAPPPVQNSAMATQSASDANGLGNASAAAGASPGVGAAVAAAAPIIAIVMALKEAAKFVATALVEAGRRVRVETDSMRLEMKNQTLDADLSRRRSNFETTARVLSSLKMDELANITRGAGDIQTGYQERTLRIREETQQMAQNLGRFSQSLSSQLAQTETSRVRRQVSEAQILGDRLGQLTAQQRDIEMLQQQIAILRNARTLDEQRNETTKQIRDLQSQLNDEMRKANKSLAKQVKAMEKNGLTPLDALLQGVEVPANPPDDKLAEELGRIDTSSPITRRL